MNNFISEQLAEVLDAMFQRDVSEEEYIIKQGDDGDNFYVIERWVGDMIRTYGESLSDPLIHNSEGRREPVFLGCAPPAIIAPVEKL